MNKNNEKSLISLDQLEALISIFIFLNIFMVLLHVFVGRLFTFSLTGLKKSRMKAR